MWLCRNNYEGRNNNYELYRTRPVIVDEGYAWCEKGMVNYISVFCGETFDLLCPALKLKPGEIIRVVLKQTRKGIRLERV